MFCDTVPTRCRHRQQQTSFPYPGRPCGNLGLPCRCECRDRIVICFSRQDFPVFPVEKTIIGRCLSEFSPAKTALQQYWPALGVFRGVFRGFSRGIFRGGSPVFLHLRCRGRGCLRAWPAMCNCKNLLADIIWARLRVNAAPQNIAEYNVAPQNSSPGMAVHLSDTPAPGHPRPSFSNREGPCENKKS